jgi:hypothetical protein
LNNRKAPSFNPKAEHLICGGLNVLLGNKNKSDLA